jgi:hypothetical protein
MGVRFVVRQLIPRELFICRGHVSLWQPKFLQDDIAGHRNACRFIECQVPIEPLPTEAAIRGQHKFVGWNELQAPADSVSDNVWKVRLQRAMADHAHRNFLFEPFFVRLEQG